MEGVVIALAVESGEEKASTQNVVSALMEALVDPKMPQKHLRNDTPPEDIQNSIAKQMHAVVLLYNCYHRKQNLELEFVKCKSFCKLAVLLRPSMIKFMKMLMVKGGEMLEENGAEDQLSVTEKAIKNACNIALSLYASKEVPITEEFPISKVAVLLIDSNKNNCFLQYGVVTEGVWSLIEKEINESSNSLEKLAEEKVCKKRKMDYLQPDSTYTSTYLQLGYEAVKDVAGIDSSDLVVLESHVVQSLNKEKSAAQFYMMLCSHSFDERHSVPLEFLVDSLQGSVAVEFNGSWSTTPLVDYHHMLPYVGFISSWIPRKESCKPIFNGCNARSTNSSYKEELPQSKIPALPPSMCIGEDLDHINIDNPEMKSNTSNNDVNENRVSGIQSTKRNGNAREEFKDLGDFLNSFKKVRQITLEEVDKDSGKYERGSFSEPLKGISQNRVKDNHGMQEMDINDYIKSSFKTEERRSSRIKASYQRRKNVPSAQHSANGPEDGVNLKVESANILKSKDSPCRDKKITAENGGTSVSCNPTANILKSKDSPCGDKKITAENGGMTVSCNLTGTAATENAVVKFDAPHNTQEDNTSASESSQNALALLNRKRRELCSQICAMEEKLAVYEHSIERIRDGGEVGFARQCINSILSGKDDLLVSNVQQVLPVENQKDPLHPTNAGLSCSFLPGKSLCQDLEYTCVMNNWRLPRYFIQPSDGKFVANVVNSWRMWLF